MENKHRFKKTQVKSTVKDYVLILSALISFILNMLSADLWYHFQNKNNNYKTE